jgi:hypothetical protein
MWGREGGKTTGDWGQAALDSCIPRNVKRAISQSRIEDRSHRAARQAVWNPKRWWYEWCYVPVVPVHRTCSSRPYPKNNHS